MPKVLLINPSFNITMENYDSSISVGLLALPLIGTAGGLMLGWWTACGRKIIWI